MDRFGFVSTLANAAQEKKQREALVSHNCTVIYFGEPVDMVRVVTGTANDLNVLLHKNKSTVYIYGFAALGNTLAERVEILHALKRAGCHVLDVLSGLNSADQDRQFELGAALAQGQASRSNVRPIMTDELMSQIKRDWRDPTIKTTDIAHKYNISAVTLRSKLGSRGIPRGRPMKDTSALVM